MDYVKLGLKFASGLLSLADRVARMVERENARNAGATRQELRQTKKLTKAISDAKKAVEDISRLSADRKRSRLRGWAESDDGGN